MRFHNSRVCIQCYLNTFVTYLAAIVTNLVHGIGYFQFRNTQWNIWTVLDELTRLQLAQPRSFRPETTNRILLLKLLTRSVKHSSPLNVNSHALDGYVANFSGKTVVRDGISLLVGWHQSNCIPLKVLRYVTCQLIYRFGLWLYYWLTAYLSGMFNNLWQFTRT
jgi:hypothetical protein